MKLLLIPVVWIFIYFGFAIMFSFPFAFAFWDIKILTSSIIFWQEPYGGGAIIRVFAFFFSSLGTAIYISEG